MARRIWKPITLACRDAETEARLVEAVGMDWRTAVMRQMRGQTGGHWEVAWGWDVPDFQSLGGIPLSSPDDFIALPMSGDCRAEYLDTVPPQIVKHIVHRLLEIFGKDGPGGSWAEYAWLEENYGISEEDDNKWLDILGYYQGDLQEQPSWDSLTEEEQRDIWDFVSDREKHLPFLFELARKYDAVKKKYRITKRRT
jgi:hypothetical protein